VTDDVVVVDIVMVDVAEVVVLVVDSIGDHIHFGTYHRLDFGHQY